jgi:hypothetical protein
VRLNLTKHNRNTYRTSSGKVEKALGTVEVSLRIGPIVLKTDMVVMPSGCGYNMLLGNELMTTLRADIMQSGSFRSGRLHYFGSYVAQGNARRRKSG